MRSMTSCHIPAPHYDHGDWNKAAYASANDFGPPTFETTSVTGTDLTSDKPTRDN